MKIAIVGYGKMGHMIEDSAKRIGIEISATIDPFASDASVRIPAVDSTNPDSVAAAASEAAIAVQQSGADGVIEFSHPLSVMANIRAILPLKLPLVVGTTGWKDNLEEVVSLAKKTNGTLLHSSNFSLGVNMFYRIVSAAAELMSQFDEYDCAVWEAHHNQKADSPSGTALEIAKLIMEKNKSKTYIQADAFHSKPDSSALHVSSMRLGSVPGTHKVFFDSSADTIELTHTARNREGLANGAVRAMEKLYSGLQDGSLEHGRVYTLQDVL